MSDFDYYYAFYDKVRGSEVLDALRQGNDQIKAEAIDYLIDRGYLHSEEIYNSAYVNALGDYLGISEYGDDEEEFEASVARGTKHSALDEVHQRLREAGKKRRQQRIAQARRMKQRKFEGHHGHHHAAEMEMTPDIMDYPGLPVVPDSYGTNSALDSGNGVPVWYGSAETFIPWSEEADSEYCYICGKDNSAYYVEEEDNICSSCEKNWNYDSDKDGYVKIVTKEAPFAGAGSLFKFGGNDSALGGFTAKELTESSAIHGDFDHAALNYSGHQNIEARAEGYGDMSRYIRIDYTWDYQGEHEEAVSDADYYITDRIHELVEQEVHNGEYSGNGYYTYTVEYENDKGETIEEDVDIDFSWS